MKMTKEEKNKYISNAISEFIKLNENIYEVMSINAKPGTKVFYCFPKNGNSWDFEKLRQLKLNKEYTVEAIQAHSFNTDIWLKEFPGVCFNHVNFGILIN